jgi:hypothetical protein
MNTIKLVCVVSTEVVPSALIDTLGSVSKRMPKEFVSAVEGEVRYCDWVNADNLCVDVTEVDLGGFRVNLPSRVNAGFKSGTYTCYNGVVLEVEVIRN